MARVAWPSRRRAGLSRALAGPHGRTSCACGNRRASRNAEFLRRDPSVRERNACRGELSRQSGLSCESHVGWGERGITLGACTHTRQSIYISVSRNYGVLVTLLSYARLLRVASLALCTLKNRTGVRSCRVATPGLRLCLNESGISYLSIADCALGAASQFVSTLVT